MIASRTQTRGKVSEMKKKATLMFELEKAPKNVTYKCYLLRIGYLYRGMISNKGYFSTDIVNIFGDNHGYKENDKVC